jgi:hypothetical protein
MIGVYVARRALIDALVAKTAVGQPLEGMQVDYAAPAEFGPRCIYAGMLRFDHTPTVAEPNVLVDEVSTVSLWLRATAKTPATVRDTDTTVETMAGQVTAVLAAQPNLGGGLSWQGVASGQGGYFTTQDEVASTLSLQILLGKRVTYV